MAALMRHDLRIIVTIFLTGLSGPAIRSATAQELTSTRLGGLPEEFHGTRTTPSVKTREYAENVVRITKYPTITCDSLKYTMQAAEDLRQFNVSGNGGRPRGERMGSLSEATILRQMSDWHCVFVPEGVKFTTMVSYEFGQGYYREFGMDAKILGREEYFWVGSRPSETLAEREKRLKSASPSPERKPIDVSYGFFRSLQIEGAEQVLSISFGGK